MIKELHYSKKKNRYYWTGENTCSSCDKELGPIGIFNSTHFKKVTVHGIYCIKCFRRFRNLGYIEQNRFVIIIERSLLPIEAIPIIPRTPEIKSGELSKLDIGAIDKKYSKDQNNTIDKTRYANRESWEGSKIGVAVKEKQIELNSQKSIDKYLLEQKK